MVRVLSDYKEIDTRPRWEKIAAVVTSILVVLLIPTTALGYFSESSLPGQPLYPMKRGIETMILALESLTPYQKSLYYQSLATKRVTEAQAVIADSLSTGDLTNGSLSTSDQALSSIVVTVQQEQQAANTLQNPVQKQAAQQQLATAIQKYQTQLTSMNYTIQQHLISTSAPTTEPTQTEALPTTTTQTINSTASATTTAVANLQDQISQTQTDLQTIANQLQTTDQQQNYQPIETPFPTTPYQQQDRQRNQTQQQKKDR